MNHLFDSDWMSSGKASTTVLAVSAATYVITLIVNGINGTLGKYSVKKVSDMYRIQVTPPPSTFAIWGVIYTLVTISLVHAAWTNSWTSQAHALFTIGNILNAVWIYVWCRGSKGAVMLAAVIQVLMVVNLYATWSALHNPQETGSMYFLYRNTFAVYLAWVIAATMVSFGMVLIKCVNLISDKTYTPFFFVVCPLIVAVASLHIYNTEGLHGIKSSLGLWAALLWALWGASKTARGIKE